MTKLRELLIDERAFDEELLADALLNLIRLGSDGSMRPGPKWTPLRPVQKVVGILLGSKAGLAVGVRKAEYLSPLEIATLAGLPGGTVRPKLRALATRGVVEQDAEARYRVTPMALDEAIRILGDSR